ncbi:MAG TPA: DUF1801 domain-containing protein [Mucilaginibacter sp.]|jgi:hypothetical protein
MAEMKTKPTEVTVESFLNNVADEKARNDSFTLVHLMEKVTGEKAKMWGPGIVGFGKYHYKYGSGHEGDICLSGFSPRKGNLSLYVLAGFPGQEELLAKLGKHKAGKGCLFVKKLDDVNLDVLESLVKQSADYMRKKYPES